MTQEAKEKKEISVPTVTLTINGREITVPKGTTVLEASLQNGIHIPTFCWHPKLKSVGSCRMCYVEIEKMRNLMVSCATEATNGMIVHTESEKVLQGRKAVIEFILANHPLDCPTCDKGGECDLQNQTFEHGYDDSRFDFRKHRFVDEKTNSTFDDLKIGPELVLNRNRCILCYKCVRANKEAFNEYDLGAYERGNITEIHAAPGQAVDNPFSGNLAEICPVGALTNSDWRYKIRVWLTQTVDGICNFSSSGTNLKYYKEGHQNKIFRVMSNPKDAIDDGWINDITRYGYQIVNSADRLKKPLIKKEGKQVEVSWDEAIEVIYKRLTEIKDKMGSVCIGGLASPNLDNASLYSFNKFFRKVLNSNNVDFRTHYRMLPADENSIFSSLSSQNFSIADIDDSDVIVTFGSDLIREHQNEYLRIIKAKQFGNARVYSINPYAMKSADVANLELIYKPGFDEQVINGICLSAIEDNLVDSSKASELKNNITPNNLNEISELCGVSVNDFKIIAKALSEGMKITFIIGELIVRSREREAISTAVSNLNYLFDLNNKGQVAVLARYANTKGAEKLGLLPHPHAAIKKELESSFDCYPQCEAHNTDSMLALMKKEEISGLVIMGSNPMMLYPDREFVKEGLGKLDFLVVCDLFDSETTELADVVLPLSSWAEYEGDYVNLEGKVQTSGKAIKPIGDAKPGYDIIKMMADKYETSIFDSDDDMQTEIDQLLKIDSFMKLPQGISEVKVAEEKIDEGFDIPLFVNDDPHHSGHWTEKSPSLMNFAGEAYLELAPEMAEKYNLNEGDPVRVESPVSKIIVPVKISEHLENDVVLLPRNFSSTHVTSLMMRKKRVDRVKLSRVDD